MADGEERTVYCRRKTSDATVYTAEGFKAFSKRNSIDHTAFKCVKELKIRVQWP